MYTCVIKVEINASDPEDAKKKLLRGLIYGSPNALEEEKEVLLKIIKAVLKAECKET